MLRKLRFVRPSACTREELWTRIDNDGEVLYRHEGWCVESVISKGNIIFPLIWHLFMDGKPISERDQGHHEDTCPCGTKCQFAR